MGGRVGALHWWTSAPAGSGCGWGRWAAPEIQRDRGHVRAAAAGGHQRGDHHHRCDRDSEGDHGGDRQGEADYVLALKGNQETLHQAIMGHIDERLEGTWAGPGAVTMRRAMDVRGWELSPTPCPESLPGSALWKGLKSIGVVTSCCLRDGKETHEIRYYISSLAVSVKKFAHAVRGHWGIENSCHWSLDITYREDESRIRDQRLHKFRVAQAHHRVSLLKQHQGRKSVAMKRDSLRLERELHAGSPYWNNHLVCAGPAPPLPQKTPGSR